MRNVRKNENAAYIRTHANLRRVKLSIHVYRAKHLYIFIFRDIGPKYMVITWFRYAVVDRGAISCRTRAFLLNPTSSLMLGLPSLLSNTYLELYASPWLKWPESEAEHSSPNITEDKNACRSIAVPYTHTWNYFT
jgi:hypothetical protein